MKCGSYWSYVYLIRGTYFTLFLLTKPWRNYFCKEIFQKANQIQWWTLVLEIRLLGSQIMHILFIEWFDWVDFEIWNFSSFFSHILWAEAIFKIAFHLDKMIITKNSVFQFCLVFCILHFLRVHIPRWKKNTFFKFVRWLHKTMEEFVNLHHTFEKFFHEFYKK